MKALGCARSTQSADIQKSRVVGDSDLCSRALCQLVLTCVEPKLRRPENQIGLLLGEAIGAEKVSGRPIRLVRSRIAAKAAKLLFRELVAATRDEFY